MLTGRVPARADEVALGASTAAQLGARTGDTLLGNAENAGAPRVRVRVVGATVAPFGTGLEARKESEKKNRVRPSGKAREYVLSPPVHPGPF